MHGFFEGLPPMKFNIDTQKSPYVKGDTSSKPPIFGIYVKKSVV